MESRQRVLIIGAGPTARALAGVIGRSSDVCLVDSSREHCAFAEADRLDVINGNALDSAVLHRAGASRAEVLVALTPNAEVNALVAQLARNTFALRSIHVLCGKDVEGHRVLLEHISATTLFGGPATITDWDYWLQHGQVSRSGLTIERLLPPPALFDELQKTGPCIPLALRRGTGYHVYHGGLRLQRGDRVILLRATDVMPGLFDRFDRIVARCPVLDLDKSRSLEEFFTVAAAALSEAAEMSSVSLVERFLDHETMSSTVIAPGLAIPHVLVDGENRFHLVIVRSRNGIPFPGQHERVHAAFVIARSFDQRNLHLRALAAIAQIVQHPDFEPKWLEAPGPDNLRKIVLESDRRRYPEWQPRKES